ncbi:MAG: CHAT domain-containing protein, partial [Symploca sp. SIO2E6]|nr:CHAT domain-containing protein [Symploca sp. SIO2E6]
LNGGNVDSIDGAGGTNTIVGDNIASTWNLTGGNAGNLNGANDFTEIQNLIGGSNNDSFVFADGVNFNSNISDNGGTDSFNFSLYTTDPNVNLDTLGALGIEEVIGTTNVDSTLIGANSANDWQITANNAGIINGINFTDFNNLIGGNLEDTFTLNGGNVDSITGRRGNNTIVGDNTNNTWNLTGRNAGNINGTNNFTQIQNFTGGSLDDSFVVADGIRLNGNISDNGGTDNIDFSAYTSDPNVNLNTLGAVGIEEIIGTTAAARSTLIGANNPNTWEITGTNSGIINNTLNFTNFDSLIGGRSADTFIVSGGSVTNINGGRGRNTLAGDNRSNTWNLTSPNAGNLNGTNNFTGIQNFTGGSLDDSFVVADGVRLNGSINGNEGIDNVDFSAYTTPLTVNLNTLDIVSIETIIGTTTAESTLVGANNPNIWEITGTNSGIINSTLNFTDFNSLMGGSVEDTFIFNGGNVANINGAAGNNTIIGNNTSNTWNLTGAGTGNLNGTNNFTQIQNFTGGNSDDTFIFSNDASINGNLDGRSGNLTLRGDNINFSGNVSGTGNLFIEPLETTSSIQIGGTNTDPVAPADTDLIDTTDTDLIDTTDTDLIDTTDTDLIDTTDTGLIDTTDTDLIDTTDTDNTSVLYLTSNQLSLLQDGFNSITIGHGAGSGDITLADHITFNDPITLQTPLGSGSIDTTGFTLTAPGINLTAADNITTGALNLLPTTDVSGNNSLNINTPGTVNLEGSITTNGADFFLGNEISPNQINLNASVFTSGGNINFNSVGNIAVANNLIPDDSSIDPRTITLDSSNSNGNGGDITLHSQTQAVTINHLNSSGALNGGNIEVSANTQISTGQIDSRGVLGVAGNVTLSSPGAIQVDSINAEGGTTGGRVDITTDSFFQATDSFIAANGLAASISTIGANSSGPISIRHGGNGEIAFDVGTSNSNSTVGTITSGDFTINPLASFLFTHQEGNIEIISVDEPPPSPSDNFDPNSNSTVVQTSIINPVDLSEILQEGNPAIIRELASLEVDTAVEEIEESINNSFEEHLGLSDTPTVNLQQAQATLHQVEESTGVKPALIYAFFVPSTVSSPTTAESKEIRQLPSANSANDELELVLVTSDGKPIRRRVGKTRKEVIRVAQQFRLNVTNVENALGYLDPAQQLHQWLIAPLQADLETQQIQNLVFILDQGLRSLPIAALHDGTGFLIEQYSVGLMPTLSLTNTSHVNLKHVEVLAMGAEKFSDRNPLPAVPLELDIIADALWPGESFLNQEFTHAQLRQIRSRKPFGIIHLATHGDFLPGKPGNSHIQLWDTKLTLDSLRDLGWSNPAVELVVLSACRTALGDNEAELGFAGLAVLAGAKSALASLWYVSDTGTLGLMRSFYEQLHTAPIKTQALRHAQLAMLNHEVRIEGRKLVSKSGSLSLPPQLQELDNIDLSHPFYWSAFTMIGNPW